MSPSCPQRAEMSESGRHILLSLLQLGTCNSHPRCWGAFSVIWKITTVFSSCCLGGLDSFPCHSWTFNHSCSSSFFLTLTPVWEYAGVLRSCLRHISLRYLTGLFYVFFPMLNWAKSHTEDIPTHSLVWELHNVGSSHGNVLTFCCRTGQDISGIWLILWEGSEDWPEIP